MLQKKERLLKRKHREEMLLNDFKKPCIVGITRTCRIRAPVNYTFGIIPFTTLLGIEINCF